MSRAAVVARPSTNGRRDIIIDYGLYVSNARADRMAITIGGK